MRGLFAGQLGHLQDLGHAQYAIERRPDLVTHICKEFGLGETGALGPLPGHIQRGGLLDICRHIHVDTGQDRGRIQSFAIDSEGPDMPITAVRPGVAVFSLELCFRLVGLGQACGDDIAVFRVNARDPVGR